MKNLSLILLVLLASASAGASTGAEGEPRPLVQVHVSIEMDAINESLASTSESMADISDSFQLMAQNGQLDPEQQQRLTEIFRNLNQLLDATNTSVDALPSLVRQSRDALVAQGAEFFSDIKFWTITVLVVLIATAIFGVIGLYHFVLRPLKEAVKETAANISEMAQALGSTAQSLETNNRVLRSLLEPDGEKREHSPRA